MQTAGLPGVDLAAEGCKGTAAEVTAQHATTAVGGTTGQPLLRQGVVVDPRTVERCGAELLEHQRGAQYGYTVAGLGIHRQHGRVAVSGSSDHAQGGRQAEDGGNPGVDPAQDRTWGYHLGKQGKPWLLGGCSHSSRRAVGPIPA